MTGKAEVLKDPELDFDSLTAEEMEAMVPRESREFYGQLEKLCKRFQPVRFIPSIVTYMRGKMAEGKYVAAPAFQIAYLIEGVCAYTRGQNDDPLSMRSYAKLRGLLQNREDPALYAVIKRSIDWFMRVMYREQMELQQGRSPYEASNALELYRDATLAAEITNILGVSPVKWVSLCLGVYSTTLKSPNGTISGVIPDSEKSKIAITEAEIRLVLDRMSMTPREIGKNFLQKREQIDEKYHPHIRSPFIRRPFIALKDGQYNCPFPGPAYRSMFSELYEVAKEQCPSFQRAFSPAMESIVKQTIECMPGVNRIYTSVEIEAATNEKSCDFIFEGDNFTAFIECKAASFNRDLLMPSTVRTDNSTLKIQKAHKQLAESVRQYKANGLGGLVKPRDVELIGITITYGDIPSSNASWYYDQFIRENICKELGEDATRLFAHTEVPINLSLEVFQVLTVYLRSKKWTLIQSIKKYCERPYVVNGEMKTFLNAEMAELDDPDAGLPFVRANVASGFRSLVIDDI